MSPAGIGGRDHRLLSRQKGVKKVTPGFHPLKSSLGDLKTKLVTFSSPFPYIEYTDIILYILKFVIVCLQGLLP